MSLSTQFSDSRAALWSGSSPYAAPVGNRVGCPIMLISWTAIYDLARREAEHSVSRLRWIRTWEPSTN